MALFHLFFSDWVIWGLRLPGGSKGKESACRAGDAGDMGPIPGWGRSARKGNGNPLQYSCLRNPVDRGVWWTTVHKVAQCQAWLSMCIYLSIYLSNMRTTSWPPFWQRQPLHSAILGRGDSASESRWPFPGAEWWGCCSPATRDSQHAAQQGWLLHTCPFRRYGNAITPPCSGFLLTPARAFSFLASVTRNTIS